MTSYYILQLIILVGEGRMRKAKRLKALRTSLVVQWLRIHLQMHGTQVRTLVAEDPTCHGATKPVSHNY